MLYAGGGVSARGGSNHNAERPVQLPYPQGPVVGRGIGISPEERWCTPCRGLHDPAKVNNPNWQPYSIRYCHALLDAQDMNDPSHCLRTMSPLLPALAPVN